MKVDVTQRRGVIYYHCPSWENTGVAHGFSTRVGGVSPAPWDCLNLGANCGDDPQRVEENFRRFCSAVGTDVEHLMKNQQVHGDLVRPIQAEEPAVAPGVHGTFQADGLITDVPGICLTIFTADCVPILLWDPKRKVAAAVHAGWRGTALGIAARAAEQMQRDYGSAPQDIQAAIGPCISSCCFETHRDVPDGLYAGLGEEAKPLIRPAGVPGKFMVDLKGANVRWLQRSGVEADHIAVCRACTACTPGQFWSHRRLGSRRGSLASMIQIL